MNIEIVTSCINCVAPGNLFATLVVVIGAGVAVRAELQNANVTWNLRKARAASRRTDF